MQSSRDKLPQMGSVLIFVYVIGSIIFLSSAEIFGTRKEDNKLRKVSAKLHSFTDSHHSVVQESIHSLKVSFTEEFNGFSEKVADAAVSAIDSAIKTNESSVLAFVQSTAEGQATFSIANLLEAAFGGDWKDRLKQMVVPPIVGAAKSFASTMLPRMENMVAESAMPPTLPSAVYDSLARPLLQTTSNHLEELLGVEVDDSLWDHPRSKNFNLMSIVNNHKDSKAEE